MIDRLPDWTWDIRATGIVMTRGRERIRYVERAMPVSRLVDVARDTSPAGWRATGAFAIERYRTCENELALLGTEPGTMAGETGVRTLGMVYLDDWYALVDGIAIGTDVAAFCRTVRALTESDRHCRGVRSRRFVYEPPRGWSGMRVAPYHAYWFAPGYPRTGAFVVVFPAQPRVASVEQLATNLLASDAEDPLPSSVVSTKRGLSGLQVETQVARSHRTIVVLEDRSYHYPVLLQTPSTALTETAPVLRALIDSIDPFTAAETASHASLWPVD